MKRSMVARMTKRVRRERRNHLRVEEPRNLTRGIIFIAYYSILSSLLFVLFTFETSYSFQCVGQRVSPEVSRRKRSLEPRTTPGSCTSWSRWDCYFECGCLNWDNFIDLTHCELSSRYCVYSSGRVQTRQTLFLLRKLMSRFPRLSSSFMRRGWTGTRTTSNPALAGR